MRNYNNEEMVALVGKKVLAIAGGAWLVLGISDNFKLFIGEIYYDSSEVRNTFTHPNGDPLGVEEKLSADGLTLDELKEKRAGGAVIQYKAPSGWEDLVQRVALDKSDIEYYRIKPTIKYYRPTKIPVEKIKGEIPDQAKKKPTSVECLGIRSDGTFFVLLNDTIYTDVNFRIPEFSPENPPPKGWRFKYSGIIYRFEKYNNNYIFDELGDTYHIDEITWMDIDETI